MTFGIAQLTVMTAEYLFISCWSLLIQKLIPSTPHPAIHLQAHSWRVGDVFHWRAHLRWQIHIKRFPISTVLSRSVSSRAVTWFVLGSFSSIHSTSSRLKVTACSSILAQAKVRLLVMKWGRWLEKEEKKPKCNFGIKFLSQLSSQILEAHRSHTNSRHHLQTEDTLWVLSPRARP